MAIPATDNYSSDDDLIHEDQIEYTILDEEVAPIEEIVIGENENLNYGVVDILEYERVRDQAEDLDGRNWELKLKCKIYEQQLRILKRTTVERIKDRIRHWKKIAANVTRRTKMKIKRMCRQSTEDITSHLTLPRYKDMLEARYYPHDLNLD